MDLGGGNDWEVIIKGSSIEGGVTVFTGTGITNNLEADTSETFIMKDGSFASDTFTLHSTTGPGALGKKLMFRNLDTTFNMVLQKQGPSPLTTLTPGQFCIVQQVDLGTGNDWTVLFQGTSTV
jgi:hypothetical protein